MLAIFRELLAEFLFSLLFFYREITDYFPTATTQTRARFHTTVSSLLSVGQDNFLPFLTFL